MYAVMKAGTRQYRVQKGELLKIDRIVGQPGDQVVFDEIMLIGGDKARIGTPLIAGAKVEAVIKKQMRDPKVIVFKFKRRKKYKKTRGHKQQMTVIEIQSIKA